FLNAIVYMRKFDGAKPLVEKRTRARGWMDQYVDGLRQVADDASRIRTYYLGQFPPDVVERTGGDPDALAEWLDGVREHLRSGDDSKFVVDEDLRELGLSNRKPELLAWLANTLEADPEDARALRLAARYLGEHG